MIYYVQTPKQFRTALKKAKSGDLIRIKNALYWDEEEPQWKEPHNPSRGREFLGHWHNN